MLERLLARPTVLKHFCETRRSRVSTEPHFLLCHIASICHCTPNQVIDVFCLCPSSVDHPRKSHVLSLLRPISVFDPPITERLVFESFTLSSEGLLQSEGPRRSSKTRKGLWCIHENKQHIQITTYLALRIARRTLTLVHCLLSLIRSFAWARMHISPCNLLSLGRELFVRDETLQSTTLSSLHELLTFPTIHCLLPPEERHKRKLPKSSTGRFSCFACRASLPCHSAHGWLALPTLPLSEKNVSWGHDCPLVPEKHQFLHSILLKELVPRRALHQTKDLNLIQFVVPYCQGFDGLVNQVPRHSNLVLGFVR